MGLLIVCIWRPQGHVKVANSCWNWSHLIGQFQPLSTQVNSRETRGSSVYQPIGTFGCQEDQQHSAALPTRRTSNLGALSLRSMHQKSTGERGIRGSRRGGRHERLTGSCSGIACPHLRHLHLPHLHLLLLLLLLPGGFPQPLPQPPPPPEACPPSSTGSTGGTGSGLSLYWIREQGEDDSGLSPVLPDSAGATPTSSSRSHPPLPLPPLPTVLPPAPLLPLPPPRPDPSPRSLRRDTAMPLKEPKPRPFYAARWSWVRSCGPTKAAPSTRGGALP